MQIHHPSRSVAGEAAAEGERHLRLRGVPRRVAHAVAPRVEVGLLNYGLALAHFNCDV